jgi:phosphoenolpyruvate-protein phosphotransferase (PTS system enzyme I)
MTPGDADYQPKSKGTHEGRVRTVQMQAVGHRKRNQTDTRRRGESEKQTKRKADSGRSSRRRRSFRGIAVVPGIAIGRAHMKFRQTVMFSDRHIDADDVPYEIERLREAIRISKEQLLVARGKVAKEIGEVEATIFDTHIALFDDQSLIGKMIAEVERNLKPVEVVVSEIVEGYYRALRMVEDDHIRERAADIRDVGRRLLNNLTALDSKLDEIEAVRPTSDGDIIFARELLPSDIAMLEERNTLGVVSETGNDRGHVAVMLRAMNLPCVMGVDGLNEYLRDGDQVITDGSSGLVLVNPRADTIADYLEKQQEFEAYRKLLNKEKDLASQTQDGEKINLLTNVSQAGELSLMRMYNADGVGLYRTEFELMTRSSFPDEDVQYVLYREMVMAMEGRPITFRTMDIGSEKELAYLDLPREENHALGKRSIRLAKDLEEYQLLQLRAILRASAHGDVRVMFPFVTNVEDIRYGKRLLRQAMRALDQRKMTYRKDMPVGMMIEVPAVAFSLDKFVREVQFFSIGTNDLTQYLCAADRNQKDVAGWYSAHNPGMLSLLKHIVETLHGTGRELTMCGEMAGDPLYTMFLVGIGVRNLSMSAPQVPLVKKIVRALTVRGARRLAEKALTLSTTTQVCELFSKTVEQILGEDVAAWLRQR